MAKSNVYLVFDNVADDPMLIGLCKTDGLFIRNNLPYIEKVNPNYKNDLTVLRIGELKDSSTTLIPCEPVEVSWDCYVRPEQVEAPLRIDRK